MVIRTIKVFFANPIFTLAMIVLFQQYFVGLAIQPLVPLKQKFIYLAYGTLIATVFTLVNDYCKSTLNQD